ncbi:hypothetical protein RHODGE_RHODGE_03985 [Rhodoplanes serenus]|uniref:Uncharacterized protein n=1 Tax=Rhodoplanes serenus TaxID=200615 RepID=A0A3S4B3R4_9BRAD|nr:hypothetical protein [Rhodoplanes serenus]VCU10781.1 hypothetical protein RHODGE_RHODGE_03985 [Rhodoplanes serenus]
MRLVYWLALTASLLTAGGSYAQQVPTWTVYQSKSSGNVANAAATATMSAVVDRTHYLCGFIIMSTGATAATVVNATISGLLGGTITLPYAVKADPAAQNETVALDLAPCMPASAPNTAITLTLPALGAGNTNAAVAIYGYRY